MASWKKVLVSGSSIEIASITSSATPTITSIGSNYVTMIDPSTGYITKITSGNFQASLGQYSYTASADSGTAIPIGAADTLFISGGLGNSSVISSTAGGAQIAVSLNTSSAHFTSGVSKEVFDAANFVDSTELDFTVTAGTSVTAAIKSTSIANSKLENSSIYLTAGNGLTGDGSVALGASASLAVGAGLGITANANDIALKNAGSLSNNTVTLWDSGNGQLSNSSITEVAGVVTVNAGLEVGNPVGIALAGQIVTAAGVIVEAGGATVTGNSLFNNNVTITGDLTVNGTTTTINTTNLLVSDKFALFASGSDASTDGGIIVQQGATTGYALGVDASADRWALQNNLGPTATTITPDSYMVTAVGAASGPSAAPVYGGASTGYGNIHVNTSTGEIFIYS